MYTIYRLIKSMLDSKKGDIPGWMYIIGLILGLFALIMIIYITVKSGKLGAESVTQGLE